MPVRRRIERLPWRHASSIVDTVQTDTHRPNGSKEGAGRRPRATRAIGLATVTAALALAGCAPREATIRLDPATVFQTITGWEATAEIVESPAETHWRAYRDEVLARAVEEVGIDRVRLELRSGAENTHGAWSRFARGEIDYEAWRPLRYPVIDDNGDPHEIEQAGFDWSELDFHVENVVLPMRARLARRGETLFVNLCYVAFTDQIEQGAYTHDDPEEYAELILAAFLHLDRAFGFVPDAVEVILEPDRVSEWDGRLIGRAIVATAARLAEHGYAPGFIAPSVTDMANAAPYFDDILRVEGAVERMIELSYHRYRGRSRRHLAAIALRARAHGLEPAMLEWWFGRGAHRVLHEDLSLGRNTAWQGRVLVGLFDVEPTPDGVAIGLREDTRYNLQYFREVRRGAVRIGAVSTEPRHFAPLAFVNPDGSTVVVVATTGAGRITIDGLPAGAYAVSWAVREGSAGLDAPLIANGSAPVSFEMPGAGAVTVSGRAGREGVPRAATRSAPIVQ